MLRSCLVSFLIIISPTSLTPQQRETNNVIKPTGLNHSTTEQNIVQLETYSNVTETLKEKVSEKEEETRKQRSDVNVHTESYLKHYNPKHKVTDKHHSLRKGYEALSDIGSSEFYPDEEVNTSHIKQLDMRNNKDEITVEQLDYSMDDLARKNQKPTKNNNKTDKRTCKPKVQTENNHCNKSVTNVYYMVCQNCNKDSHQNCTYISNADFNKYYPLKENISCPTCDCSEIEHATKYTKPGKDVFKTPKATVKRTIQTSFSPVPLTAKIQNTTCKSKSKSNKKSKNQQDKQKKKSIQRENPETEISTLIHEVRQVKKELKKQNAEFRNLMSTLKKYLNITKKAESKSLLTTLQNNGGVKTTLRNSTATQKA